MKIILIILTAIATLSIATIAQEPKATLSLTNGQFIVNAPSGRDWTTYKVSSVSAYEATDTSYFDNSAMGSMVYYGQWVHAQAGCLCSYSNAANDSLVFIFTDANYFEWRGELMGHHGIADIYWNDKYIGEVDTYDTRNIAHTRNWKAENLDPAKVYKFKLVVTGKKNALSTGAYIVHHGFRIWKDAIAEPEPCEPEIIHKTDTLIIRDTIWMKPEIIINYNKIK